MIKVRLRRSVMIALALAVACAATVAAGAFGSVKTTKHTAKLVVDARGRRDLPVHRHEVAAVPVGDARRAGRASTR